MDLFIKISALILINITCHLLPATKRERPDR